MKIVFQKYKMLLLGLMMVSLFSCKKEYTVVDMTDAVVQQVQPLDSVLWQRNSTAVLHINLNADIFPEIALEWSNWSGLGGGGGGKMNVIIHDSNWQLLTTTYIDTTCVDTVFINGIRTFHFRNDTVCTNIHSIDTITFATTLDSISIYNPQGTYRYQDTTMCYQTNAVQPMMPYPDATYSTTKYGSSKFEHDNYLIFQNGQGVKKAIRYDYFYRYGQSPYYYLMAMIDL